MNNNKHLLLKSSSISTAITLTAVGLLYGYIRLQINRKANNNYQFINERLLHTIKKSHDNDIAELKNITSSLNSIVEECNAQIKLLKSERYATESRAADDDTTNEYEELRALINSFDQRLMEQLRKCETNSADEARILESAVQSIRVQLQENLDITNTRYIEITGLVRSIEDNLEKKIDELFHAKLTRDGAFAELKLIVESVNKKWSEFEELKRSFINLSESDSVQVQTVHRLKGDFDTLSEKFTKTLDKLNTLEVAISTSRLEVNDKLANTVSAQRDIERTVDQLSDTMSKLKKGCDSIISNDLQDKLMDFHNKYRTMSNDHAICKTVADQIDGKVKKVDSFIVDIKRYEESFAETDKSVSDCLSRLTKQDKLCTELRNNIEACTAECKTLIKAAVKPLNDVDVKLTDDLKYLKNEISNLKNILNASNLNMDTATNNFTTATLDFNILKNNLKENKSELESFKREMYTTKGKIDEFKHEIEKDKLEIDRSKREMNSKIETVQSEIVDVRRDISEYNTTVADARGMLATIKNDMFVAKNEITTTRNDMFTIKNEISIDKRHIDTTKQEMDEVKRKIDDSVENSKTHINSAKKAIDSMESVLLELKKITDINKSTLDNQSVSIEHIVKTIKQAKSDWTAHKNICNVEFLNVKQQINKLAGEASLIENKMIPFQSVEQKMSEFTKNMIDKSKQMESIDESCKKTLNVIKELERQLKEGDSLNYIRDAIYAKLSSAVDTKILTKIEQLDSVLMKFKNIDTLKIALGVNDLLSQIKSIPRPLETIEKWLSRDFGAVGDGVADDTDSFLGLIKYATDTNNPVYIEPKRYLISKTIKVKGCGVKIIGVSTKSNLVFTSPKAFEFTGCVGLYMENLMINGNGETTNGLILERCHNYNLRNIIIRNFQSGAIINGDYGKIEDCKFYLGSNGLMIVKPSNVYITNCIFSGYLTYGLLIRGNVQELSILTCVFEKSTYGLGIGDLSNDFKYSNITILNNRYSTNKCHICLYNVNNLYMNGVYLQSNQSTWAGVLMEKVHDSQFSNIFYINVKKLLLICKISESSNCMLSFNNVNQGRTFSINNSTNIHVTLPYSFKEKEYNCTGGNFYKLPTLKPVEMTVVPLSDIKEQKAEDFKNGLL